MWNDVECAYNGDYEGISGFDDFNYRDGGAFVNSQKMFTKTRETISKLIFPADFAYIVNASNSNNSIDVSSAKVAEAHLRYYWRKQRMWKKARKVLLDVVLLNRGYLRTGFKPPMQQDQVRLSEDTYLPAKSEGISMPGQPFTERIRRQNLIIEEGFASIEDAFEPGGKLGIRTYAHIDWVKANESYQNRSKILADVSYKEMDPEDQTDAGYSQIIVDGVNPIPRGDSKWVILWEIFEAPTPKYPEGRYYVIHKQTETLLFKEDKLPYRGMGFPVRELVFYEPRDSYYAVPMAYRAMNPMFEMEMFESKVLQLVANLKTILIGHSSGGDADAINEQIEAIDSFGYVDEANFSKGDIDRFDFNPDTLAAERASNRSEVRFDRIFGPTVSTPQRGDQIATLARFDNQDALQELNDQKIILNEFFEDVASDMINITETNTTEEEQRRITREMGMTISDDAEITLRGDYAISIRTSEILDMTMGEEIQMINMALTTALQALNVPGVGDRLDLLPIIAKLFDKLGIPKSDVIKDGQLDEPLWENSMLVIGNPIPVEPTDNHIEHVQKHIAYVDQLNQVMDSPDAQNNENVLISFNDENAFKELEEHIMAHVQLGDMQSEGTNQTGAWNQAKNLVNIARQSGNFTTSKAGQGAVQR